MKKKNKYDFDFKKLIVDKVIQGRLSVERVSGQYNLTISMVSRWVSFYKKHGVDGLKPIKNRYTAEDKIKIILEMRKKRLSLTETCARYKIPSFDTLKRWVKVYDSLGVIGLQVKSRGRPRCMPRKPKKPMTREEQLLDELASLRAENAYLKKLHALIQSEKKKEEKRLSSKS